MISDYHHVFVFKAILKDYKRFTLLTSLSIFHNFLLFYIILYSFLFTNI